MNQEIVDYKIRIRNMVKAAADDVAQRMSRNANGGVFESFHMHYKQCTDTDDGEIRFFQSSEKPSAEWKKVDDGRLEISIPYANFYTWTHHRTSNLQVLAPYFKDPQRALAAKAVKYTLVVDSTDGITQAFAYATEKDRQHALIRLMSIGVDFEDDHDHLYSFADIPASMPSHGAAYEAAIKDCTLQGSICNKVVTFQGVKLGTIRQITDEGMTLYSWVDADNAVNSDKADVPVYTSNAKIKAQPVARPKARMN